MTGQPELFATPAVQVLTRDKIKFIRKQLQSMRYHYRRRVEAGKMTVHAANQDIAILESILADYNATLGQAEIDRRIAAARAKPVANEVPPQQAGAEFEDPMEQIRRQIDD